MNGRICFLPLILTALAGCATAPGEPPMVINCETKIASDRPGPALVGVEYGAQASAVPLNSVQFTNWDTAGEVAIQQLYGERTVNGTVRVTARLNSCSDDARSVLVRTSFFDQVQAPTEQPSAWKRVYLPARASALYTEYSVSRNAANYLVEINQG